MVKELTGDDKFTDALIENLEIDLCIVDEAGCVLETAIPILLRWSPANLVLVGDHKQLQPFSVLFSEPGKETHHTRSLLERAVTSGLKPWLLSTQYRMPERLCDLVSRLFYKGLLHTAREIIHRDSLGSRSVRWIHCEGPEQEHHRRGYSNPSEAELAVNEAEEALRSLPGSSCFIITPYNMQKKEIEDHIRRSAVCYPLCQPESGRIKVLSVDACQGNEADFVVLSLVRTTGVNQFLEDQRRLCVAISRAKKAHIIVGHESNFKKRGSEVWQKVITHCSRG